jgi:(E)-4-hydroxy-3-methylbut-2-enyl-diphosphate synthase
MSWANFGDPATLVRSPMFRKLMEAFVESRAGVSPAHRTLQREHLDDTPSPTSSAGTGETPVLLYPLEPKIALLRAAAVIGGLLADGIGDAILVRGESGAGQSLRLAYNILQAAGCRSFKTDYVACPSCGRTLFNLQTVTARIKSRTEHLKGVKIAIMGCIVNGPGEMADADFGYVGGAPGKINLYVGKQAIKFNIPEAEAVDRLVDLIKEHNKWVEPE